MRAKLNIDNRMNQSHFDEKIAITECQNGDLSQFTFIYDAYVKKIYRYIYLKIYNKATAEDLTSEVFFKALKNIKSVDAERGISAWLYEIARNKLIDYFRTYKSNVDIEDIWELKSDSDIIQNIDKSLKYDELKKMMNELTSIQRDIITMRVWQDMDYKDISEALGLSEQNCRVIFSRSIAKLKNMFPAELLLILLLTKI